MTWGGTSTRTMKTTTMNNSILAALVLVVVGPGLTNALGLGIGGTTVGVGPPAVAGGVVDGLTAPLDLLNAVSALFGGGTLMAGGIDPATGLGIGGVAGSLALLAASLKAPLVALYSISAEIVVMVALILFISYIASMLGIDDFEFRRREGTAATERSSIGIPGIFSGIMNSQFMKDLSNDVTNSIDKFDVGVFLENLDTRFK